MRRISFFEKFIMAYGGLRGAVCFSLSHMLQSKVVKPRELFLTTTLAVIIFTVFLQVLIIFMSKMENFIKFLVCRAQL